MNQVGIMFVAPFGAAGFMLLACWMASRISRRRAVSAQPVMRLDHALAIVLAFDGQNLAMSMEEIKTLNRAREVVGQRANLLIGREPKKFGGRHG